MGRPVSSVRRYSTYPFHPIVKMDQRCCPQAKRKETVNPDSGCENQAPVDWIAATFPRRQERVRRKVHVPFQLSGLDQGRIWSGHGVTPLVIFSFASWPVARSPGCPVARLPVAICSPFLTSISPGIIQSRWEDGAASRRSDQLKSSWDPAQKRVTRSCVWTPYCCCNLIPLTCHLPEWFVWFWRWDDGIEPICPLWRMPCRLRSTLLGCSYLQGDATYKVASFEMDRRWSIETAVIPEIVLSTPDWPVWTQHDYRLVICILL
jgi:hypothetical protein